MELLVQLIDGLGIAFLGRGIAEQFLLLPCGFESFV